MVYHCNVNTTKHTQANTMNTKKKQVLDVENQLIMEEFNQANTEDLLSKYKEMNKYKIITVDNNGDILIAKNLRAYKWA
jgi:hypothetical protein